MKGQAITVRLNGAAVVTGKIEFISATRISIDEGGGIHAGIRHDPNLNRWMMGKAPVTIQTETFQARLARVVELADNGARLNTTDEAEA